MGESEKVGTPKEPGEIPAAASLEEFREGAIVGGKFRLEKVIGEGGMAIVVSATHLKLEEKVALKFLRREALGNAEVKARFAHEARAAARLKSEHVARILDVGEKEDGLPFIVMELLEGKDLAIRLRERGKMPLATAVEYVIQAAEGLAEAHARGLVHRDVKPENLFLVERDGLRHIKVLDFGICQPTRGQDPEVALVATGKLFGSPVYMSPEQLREGAEVDPRCDLWSLAVVLFELISAETPFDAKLPLESLVGEILFGHPRTLADVGIDAPVEFEALLGRCLQREAANRFQSAAELAIALLPFAPKRSRVVAEKAVLVSRTAGICDAAIELPPTLPPPGSPAPAPNGSPTEERGVSGTGTGTLTGGSESEKAPDAAVVAGKAEGAPAVDAKAEKEAVAEAKPISAPPKPDANAGPRRVENDTTSPVIRDGGSAEVLSRPPFRRALVGISAALLVVLGLAVFRARPGASAAPPADLVPAPAQASDASVSAVVPVTPVPAPEPPAPPAPMPSETASDAPVAAATEPAPAAAPPKASVSTRPPSKKPPRTKGKPKDAGDDGADTAAETTVTTGSPDAAPAPKKPDEKAPDVKKHDDAGDPVP